MSASVKAALAAKRAAAKASSRSTSPVKASASSGSAGSGGLGASSSTGSGGFNGKGLENNLSSEEAEDQDAAAAGDLSGFAQIPLPTLLNKSCDKGKLNISSRDPALKALPAELFALIEGAEPAWHDRSKSGRAWYEREDITVLQAGGNAVVEVDERLGEFRALTRLELQLNSISSIPISLVNLANLTHLNLANNNLAVFPEALLCLDKLVVLDLSSNRISQLWTTQHVHTVRSEQKRKKLEWEREHGDVDPDGMWAGYLSGPSSPIKKDKKKLLPTSIPSPSLPMRALETLKLGKNRLTNAAFSDGFAFPPRLRVLDLSDNDIRGPIPARLFDGLAALRDLNIAGTGVSDVVFDVSTASEDPVFASLALLDLSRCDLDDLAPLEQMFGSARIRGQQDVVIEEDQPQASAALPGISKKQLIRVRGTPTPASKSEELHLVLEGCPLREEEFKRKRGPGYASRLKQEINPSRSMHSSSSSTTTDSDGTGRGNNKRSASKDTLRGETRQSSGFEPSGGDHGSPGGGTPMVGSGLNGRGPNSAGSPQSATGASNEQSSALAAQMQNLNLVSPTKQVQKEEWELLAEAGLLTEGGRRRLRAEQARRERELQQQGAALSTSASALRGRQDLTPQQLLLLQQQQQQGRQQQDFLDGADADAGSALANAKLSTKKKEALSQVPCKFFRSNGCSAGAACPFAHTYPGEGAQKATCQWFLKGNCRFGHKCALAHILPGQPISMDRKNKRAVQHGLPLPQVPSENLRKDGEAGNLGHAQGVVPPFAVDPSLADHSAAWLVADPMTAMRGRDGDFMFGLPDDFGAREGAGIAMPGTSPSARRSIPGRLGADPALLSGSPSSGAFGTSPFGQGAQVFFSSSQGSDADAVMYGQQELQRRAAQRVDEDEGLDEADFLPSSLSDLLTPEELERRKRASHGAQSLPASAGYEKDSWPAHMPAAPADNAGRQSPASAFVRKGFGSPLRPSALGTSTGFGLESRSQFAPPIANPPLHAYSPGSRAALGQHAPGQSLPRGLAAGLSRLHYQHLEEDMPSAKPIQAFQPASPSQQNLDDLAPVAPSSVLPPRHNFGIGEKGPSRHSGTLLGSSPHSLGVPRGGADYAGMPIPGLQAGSGNMPAPIMSPSKSAVSRLRAESSRAAPSRTPGSPLAVPTSSREEEEETMFQLE